MNAHQPPPRAKIFRKIALIVGMMVASYVFLMGVIQYSKKLAETDSAASTNPSHLQN